MLIPNSKIVAIIQARMTSSRLPGKIMADIGGEPMIRHVVERARRARRVGQVAVATSDHPEDNIVEEYCRESGIPCIRGSLDDVLDRYYTAAKSLQADIAVRVTADCPLLDPLVVDSVIAVYSQGDFDYVSNTILVTYPDGLDTEVFSFTALDRAWQEANLKSEREHVTPYIRKHPELFRCANVKHSEDLSHLRWTVDMPEDLDFVRTVYAHFGKSEFGMPEILEFLGKNPELGKMNAHYQRNEGYLKSLREDQLIRK